MTPTSETTVQHPIFDFTFDDGGRSKYFKGKNAGDCVVRSIAIATGKDYKEVYNALFALAKKKGDEKPSPRKGVAKRVYEDYLKSIGWKWVPTMQIGEGCKVHLKKDELPNGRLIVKVSKHVTALIDGVIHDIDNPSRGGTRCVYGYFTKQ